MRRAIAIGEVRELDPIGEPDESCHEVGAIAACSSARAVRAMPLPDPPEPAPPDTQWRCDPGPPRRCALILRRPFECSGPTCIQRHPRLPDDADWECADVEGLVVCRDRPGPAGAVRGPPELGWICSEERTPRICIDLDPDRPGAGSYDCSYAHEPAIERRCRAIEAPSLGSPCRGECPEGMRCAGGACIPDAIAPPDCWTSADCHDGQRCVLARCRSAEQTSTPMGE